MAEKKPILMNQDVFTFLCKVSTYLEKNHRMVVLAFDVFDTLAINNSIAKPDGRFPTHCIVFDVKFVSCLKHQIIGHICYFMHSSRRHVAQAIQAYIHDLYLCDLTVIASVSSGCREMMTVLLELQPDLDLSGLFSYHVARCGKVFHFFDPPWLMRELKAYFLRRDIVYYWDDKKMKASNQCLYTLHKKIHVFPLAVRSRTTACATGYFSNRLANAIMKATLFLDDSNPYMDVITGTANLFHFIDCLFDSMNSCDLESSEEKILRQSMVIKSGQKLFWLSCSEVLKTMRLCGKTRKMKRRKKTTNAAEVNVVTLEPDVECKADDASSGKVKRTTEMHMLNSEDPTLEKEKTIPFVGQSNLNTEWLDIEGKRFQFKTIHYDQTDSDVDEKIDGFMKSLEEHSGQSVSFKLAKQYVDESISSDETIESEIKKLLEEIQKHRNKTICNENTDCISENRNMSADEIRSIPLPGEVEPKEQLSSDKSNVSVDGQFAFSSQYRKKKSVLIKPGHFHCKGTKEDSKTFEYPPDWKRIKQLYNLDLADDSSDEDSSDEFVPVDVLVEPLNKSLENLESTIPKKPTITTSKKTTSNISNEEFYFFGVNRKEQTPLDAETTQRLSEFITELYRITLSLLRPTDIKDEYILKLLEVLKIMTRNSKKFHSIKFAGFDPVKVAAALSIGVKPIVTTLAACIRAKPLTSKQAEEMVTILDNTFNNYVFASLLKTDDKLNNFPSQRVLLEKMLAKFSVNPFVFSTDMQNLTIFEKWIVTCRGFYELVDLMKVAGLTEISTRHFNCDCLQESVYTLKLHSRSYLLGDRVVEVINNEVSFDIDSNLTHLAFTEKCNFTIK